MCEDGDVSQRKLPPKERAFRTPADPEFPVCVCSRRCVCVSQCVSVFIYVPVCVSV